MITLSQNTFTAGDLLIHGLVDAVGATSVSIGENTTAVVDGEFSYTIPSIAAGAYVLDISVYNEAGTVIDSENINITVSPAATTTETGTTGTTTETGTTGTTTETGTTGTTTETGTTGTTTGTTTETSTTGTTGTTTETSTTTTQEEVTMANSAQAQALVDLNESSMLSYIPRYTVGTESDTSNISVYPGSLTGFAPLSASTHSATKADEFKIMSDAALALNPSAGFTGGRGTGNPAKFGRYPERALMTDVRGEFFPKDGDYNSKTSDGYPLGRTADLLENATVPVEFTAKDPTTGYSTSTTRGGVDASVFPTSGFTF